MIFEVINMIKEHINDLFTEGLGDIFYMKLYNFIKKNIKNKPIKKILLGIHTVFYIIFIVLVVVIMFMLSFPL